MIVVIVFICQSLNAEVLLIILSLGYILFHKLCSSLPSQSESHSCHCILKGFPVLGSEFCRSGLKPCLVDFLASAISERWSRLQAGAELNSFFPRAVGTESLHSYGGMDVQRCSDGFSGVCLCPGKVRPWQWWWPVQGWSQPWSSFPPGWFCGMLQVPAHGIDAPIPTWISLSKHFSHRYLRLVKNLIFPFYAK